MAEVTSIKTVEEHVTEALDYAIATIGAYSAKDRHDSIVKAAMTLSLNQLIAQMEGEKKK